jgi:outer membrane protein assembly factor BamB
MRLRFAGIALLVAACATETKSDDAAPSVGLAQDSPWPKFRGDAAQTGRSALSPHDGGQFWEVKTGKGIFSSPVIAGDGTTYVGSADRTFYAIDRAGHVVWKEECGEIIDSAALLDDRGRVYFGAGDGKLRARDAKSGQEVWTFTADDPAVNKAFINWFEGNVAIGAGGTLYVPNDDFFLYAIDRDTGTVRWKFKTPDQTWSLPAVDARTGRIFVGNNNVLPLLGANTFALTPDGNPDWTSSSLGSIAASPMLVGDRVVVGGFDGYVRAYDAHSGDQKWELATREHVYASPSLYGSTVVQAGTDGTIYALDADTGAVKWTFDVDEPVRSSPAIDADGNVYFGGGDGRLWALRSDGSLRWSMKLIDDDRNDLNASPALGPDGIVIAGESGVIFGVPWDFCLKNADPRCSTSAVPRADGASLRWVSPMGATLAEPPAEIDASAPITFALSLRDGGQSKLATLDTASVVVETTPHVDLDVLVAGDGKFVTMTPRTVLPPELDVEVRANYLVDHDRNGLRLSGGRVGGNVTQKVHVKTHAADTPLAVGTSWELARLALPLPTLLPSYNQIGFDSLQWLIGVVESNDTGGVAWMVGAKPGAVADPTTKSIFPLEIVKSGGLATFTTAETMRVEVMNAIIPFESFRIAAGTTGNAYVTGGTRCAGVPFYGPFLQTLGLCNPTTDELVVVGGALLRSIDAAPADATSDDVSFSLDANGVRATIATSKIRPDAHVTGLLLVDSDTGKPVVLDYGGTTTREVGANGDLSAIAVPFGTRVAPKKVRAHLMVDTRVVATHEFTSS